MPFPNRYLNFMGIGKEGGREGGGGTGARAP